MGTLYYLRGVEVMDIKSIKEFIEWAEYIPYVEVYEGAWCLNGLDDLMWEYEPMTEDFNYSAEIQECVFRKDGLVLININTGSGFYITMALLEENEIK